MITATYQSHRAGDYRGQVIVLWKITSDNGTLLCDYVATSSICDIACETMALESDKDGNLHGGIAASRVLVANSHRRCLEKMGCTVVVPGNPGVLL